MEEKVSPHPIYKSSSSQTTKTELTIISDALVKHDKTTGFFSNWSRIGSNFLSLTRIIKKGDICPYEAFWVEEESVMGKYTGNHIYKPVLCFHL